MTPIWHKSGTSPFSSSRKMLCPSSSARIERRTSNPIPGVFHFYRSIKQLALTIASFKVYPQFYSLDSFYLVSPFRMAGWHKSGTREER